MKDQFSKILYAISAVTFIFMVFFGTLLYTEHTKIQKVNPLFAIELDSLREHIRDPGISEEHFERIRDLDFLYRQTWFTTKEHFDLGIKIILICGIILALLLQAANALQNPAEQINFKEQTKKSNSNLTITTILVSLLIMFLSTILLREYHRTRFHIDKVPAVATIDESYERIKPTKKSKENVIWHGFRGLPQVSINEISPTWTNTAAWKTSWQTKPRLKGFSSPICTDAKIFLTGASATELAIFCYSSDSGALLWDLTTKPDFATDEVMPEVTEDTGYAAATPVTDGQYIWAIFASGDLICSDMNGQIVWRTKFHIPDNMYGYSSSLLLYNNNLIIQYDDYEKQTLYNINPQNGEIIWQQDREASISWATPTLIQKNGQNIISIVTSLTIEGYILETGEQKWFHECMGGEVAPSSAYAGKYVINTCDNATTVAVDPTNNEIIWQNDEIYMPDVACPIIVNSNIYMFTSGATILCMDENTGEMLWEEDVSEGYYSTPIEIDNLLVAIDMQGNLIIIKPNSERLEIIAEKKLSMPIVTTPALHNNALIIRTFNQLIKVNLAPNEPF